MFTDCPLFSTFQTTFRIILELYVYIFLSILSSRATCAGALQWHISLTWKWWPSYTYHCLLIYFPLHLCCKHIWHCELPCQHVGARTQWRRVIWIFHWSNKTRSKHFCDYCQERFGFVLISFPVALIELQKQNKTKSPKTVQRMKLLFQLTIQGYSLS